MNGKYEHGLIFYFVLIAFFFSTWVSCIEKYDNVNQALKNYPLQDNKNGKPPKFVYFKIKKSHAHNMDYFSKILYQFLNTMGVKPYFVNLKDDQLLGIVSKEAEINKEAILSTFSDVIEKIEVKDKMDG
jgi:hypothetical protein